MRRLFLNVLLKFTSQRIEIIQNIAFLYNKFFVPKSNNSDKLMKWKNKISHFVDAQEQFKK